MYFLDSFGLNLCIQTLPKKVISCADRDTYQVDLLDERSLALPLMLLSSSFLSPGTLHPGTSRAGIRIISVALLFFSLMTSCMLMPQQPLTTLHLS